MNRQWTLKLQRAPLILNHFSRVMAGLVPAIHVLLAGPPQERMPATSAGMTAKGWFNISSERAVERPTKSNRFSGVTPTFVEDEPGHDSGEVIRHHRNALYERARLPPPNKIT